MRASAVVLGFAVLLPVAGARAACTDADAVATIRAAAEGACPCADAATHGAYVACVAGVVRAAVLRGHLPNECTRSVVRCAAHSACGRPGAVTCCRDDKHREKHCQIVRDGAACAARHGIVGACASCCDACSSGCPTTTTTSITTASSTTATTTTATSTTSTTVCAPDHCGDGVLQSECGETCDGAAGFDCALALLVCGAPTDRLACQCCEPAGVQLYGGFFPPTCCDGSECVPVAPHQCACGAVCLPANSLCSPTVPCCNGPCQIVCP